MDHAARVRHVARRGHDAVVDYLNPHFIGLRIADGLYRFLDGSAWEWPTRLSRHLLSDSADHDKAEHAWRVRLDAVSA